MFFFFWRKEIGVYSDNKEQLRKGLSPINAPWLMDPQIILFHERIQIQDYILHAYVYMKIKARHNQSVVMKKINTVFAFGGVGGQFEEV